jgi:hypothetical protein
MTHLTPHHWARAGTAIVSMAVFAAVFFELPAIGVLMVALLCLSTLFATAWVGETTKEPS